MREKQHKRFVKVSVDHCGKLVKLKSLRPSNFNIYTRCHPQGTRMSRWLEVGSYNEN